MLSYFVYYSIMNILKMFSILIVLSCLCSCSLCEKIVSAPVKIFTEDSEDAIPDERSIWQKTKDGFKWFYGIEEKEDSVEPQEKKGVFRRIGGGISKLFYWGTIGH